MARPKRDEKRESCKIVGALIKRRGFVSPAPLLPAGNRGGVSRHHTINREGRCPAKKMPGRIHARTRQKDFHYVRSRTAGNPRSSYRAARRDAPVNCPSCGREVPRRARQQRFCSRRCRQKANYGEKVARGDFSTRTIARPTTPLKETTNSRRCNWQKRCRATAFSALRKCSTPRCSIAIGNPRLAAVA
jgi:hypothetical protein